MGDNIKKYRLLFIVLIGICVICLLYTFSSSYGVVLDNDVKVAENSDLTYYLDISYDGKDKDIVMSSDTAVASVISDYIYIEDKLPDGLIFKEFVDTSDGSIGAVERGDTSKGCYGYVVDGVLGLNYNADTRVISFKIRNLQAGCKITVGIVTTTPRLGNNTRLDFYNTFFAREGSFNTKSNTVHVFMGRDDVSLYNVTYQYTGDIPDNAPALPTVSSYSSGTSVGVLNDLSLEGYIFSGWSSSDVTVSDGTFIMPSKNVTFTGSFTKKETYKVSYSISGVAPDGYLPPKEQSYGVFDDVVVDSLKSGTEINGYRFLGWEASNVDISDGIFTMPNEDVVIVGKFEKITYKVTYLFQGAVIPSDADSLLPTEKSYAPGDTVTIEDDPSADGYKFLGWYKTKTFEMPEEDVVIYGEWMVENGVFSPTIKKEITNIKDYYSEDDTVNFKITVTNTADFDISDVILKEYTDGCGFVEGDSYTVLNENFVKIPLIAASSSVEVYAEYVVFNDVVKNVTSKVELTGAIADNNYSLDTSKEYISTVQFNIANISLSINKINEDGQTITGSKFGLYSDISTDNLISDGLLFENLYPDTTYYLKEVSVPSGYVMLQEVLPVIIDSDGVITIEGYNVTNNNGDALVSIVNKKINILPNTGGVGNIPFIILGVVIILGSVFGYVYYISRKERVRK